MSTRTGEGKTLRAAAVYAVNDTWYDCTETIRCALGGDTIRLTLTSSVASVGNVTIRASVDNGSGVYTQIGGDFGPYAVADGALIAILPTNFAGGDVVKISFKCSAGATSAKLEIYGLAYERSAFGDSYSQPEAVVSVADTVYALTSDSPDVLLVSGTASGYIVRTPDATALTVGWTRRIKNVSSEFITIDNGASGTLLAWVKPGNTAEITLTAASAAGTWSVLLCDPPENLNDFHGNSLATDLMGWNPTSGTGAATDVDNGVSIAGSIGILKHTTGTSSATAHSVIRRGPVGCGRAAVMVQGKIYPTAQASAAQDFGYEVGLFTAISTLEAADGVCVRLPTNASTKTNWTGYTFGSSSATAVDSSVAYALNTWITVTVVLNSAGTRADFWAGKVYIGKSTTNLPTAGTLLYPALKLIKTNGTTSINYYADYALEDYPAPEGR